MSQGRRLMKDIVETEAFNEATIVLEEKRLLWVKCFFSQILPLDKTNKEEIPPKFDDERCLMTTN